MLLLPTLLYVNRNAKRMPDDVRAALLDIIVTHGNQSAEDAQMYINNMDRTHRYQAETWAWLIAVLFVLDV